MCVSLWHHCKGFSVFEYDGPFEEFAELFLQGKVRHFSIIRRLSESDEASLKNQELAANFNGFAGCIVIVGNYDLMPYRK